MSMNCDVKNSEVLSRPILEVENWNFLIDIKRNIQHGSFCQKMLQAMSIKS